MFHNTITFCRRLLLAGALVVLSAGAAMAGPRAMMGFNRGMFAPRFNGGMFTPRFNNGMFEPRFNHGMFEPRFNGEMFEPRFMP